MKPVLLALAIIGIATQAHSADIKLNIIQVCDDAGKNCAPVNLNQAYTDKIWAQTGTTFTYSPISQLNSSQYLNPSQTQANGLISSTTGTGRAAGAYDIWFVNSFSGAAGLRGLGALGGDGVVISSSTAAIDTLAHEIGHNFGQNHTDGSIVDASRYLMASGSIRQLPTSLTNVAPDGLQLDRLAPILPTVTLDMIGSTPFQSTSFFNVKYKTGAASDLGLSSLTLDLSPANAFFDVTNAAPGTSGSPFGYGSLFGIGSSDIKLTGMTDGSSFLKMDFKKGSFTSGDSFSFGVDVDLFSNIDGFGATADELRLSKVTFGFENGYSVSGDLETLIFSSQFDPSLYLDVLTASRGDPFGVSQVNDPGNNAVPVPQTAFLLLFGLLGLKRRFNGTHR